MRIDLHTHSTASDGTQAPRALVRAAREAGLDVVALTDHDTVAGWDEAVAAAREHGVGLVRGIELSCRHRGAGVHLLAYLPDPSHPGLAREMAAVVAGREERVPAMVERLRAHGLTLSLDDVRAAASGGRAVMGRPHVADALVARGHVADRDEAFARLLAPGGVGYVDHHATDLRTMIGLVGAAGGACVVAHPWSRASRRVLDADALAVLADAGLAGVEVDHLDHSPRDRAALRAIATDLDLVVTGSSDHHGTGKPDFHLGAHTTAPAEHQRLLDRCADAARASGRAVPGVVGR